jgi:LmbE family N-acetylglucosaminyl deacetylase
MQDLQVLQYSNDELGTDPMVPPVERVLCICARAGHETLFAGAALHRLAASGVRVSLVALSARTPTLPALRSLGATGLTQAHDALERSAIRLGVARVELLEMPPPPLTLPDRLSLQAQLCALIRDERPELVLSDGTGLPSGAIDRQTALALSDAAIAAAAAPFFGQHPSQEAAAHEVFERWLFAPPLGHAVYQRHVPMLEGAAFGHRRWVSSDAPALVQLKWEALRCYLVGAPAVAPAAVFQLLASERFLQIRSITSTRHPMVARRARRPSRQN